MVHTRAAIAYPDGSLAAIRPGVVGDPPAAKEPPSTVLQGLTSLAGAAGLALLVPFAVLLAGLPLVLAVRGLLEVIGWLFGVAIH